MLTQTNSKGIEMSYYDYFARVAKIQAVADRKAAEQRAAAKVAHQARRDAIQPQLDELGRELDAIALAGGSVAQINEVGKRIDALLASIQ